MRIPRVVAVAPIALALLIAGCGSSTKSNSSAPSPAAGTPPPSAATSSSATGGAYAPPTSSSHSGPVRAALITTKRDKKLGTILAVGPKHLTAYLFEADHHGSSNCAGGCTALWPPVTGRPEAQGAAMRADLGTITRPDGRTQITYQGHPLYLYARDQDDGDAYGEGVKSFGAEWYVLSPAGNKIDES